MAYVELLDRPEPTEESAPKSAKKEETATA
jgi:hypothetical protein